MFMAMGPDETAGLPGLLRAWRERALLTQEELAERAGLSVGTVRGLEAGRVRRPRPASVRRLADALALDEVDRDVLIGAARGPEANPAPAATGTGTGSGAGRPAPVPAELPSGPGVLVGRSAELARLSEVVESSGPQVPVVVLTGPAGAGKTALAVAWAQRTRDRFPDGQLFVELHSHLPGGLPGGSTEPIEVLTRMLRSLGLAPDQVPTGPAEASARLRSLLSGRRVLIVLDDVRRESLVRPLIPGSPGCAVLVTSRYKLTGLVALDGATAVRLGVLAPVAAREVLATVAGPYRSAAEPQALARVAELCAHLPLALRVAGAHLAANPTLTADGYARRLATEALASTLALDGDETRGVRAALDLSYRALDEPVRRVFRLLGLVPGATFSPAAVAWLAEVTEPEAARLLEVLAAAHLAEQTASGDYTAHDLLRRYAAERVAEDEAEPTRDRARERLFTGYLRRTVAAARLLYPENPLLPEAVLPVASPAAREGELDEARAVAWLEAELPALVAIARYTAAHGPYAIAFGLGDALRGWFWQRLQLAEWEQVAEAAATAAEAAQEPLALAAAALSLGDLAWFRSRYADARAQFERAIELSAAGGWWQGQSQALDHLGLACWRAGRPRLALDRFTEGLELLRRHGSTRGEAARLGNLGAVYVELGELRRAAECYAEAMALTGDLPAQYAAFLAGLGETEHLRGDFPASAAHLDAALVMARDIGMRAFVADILRARAALRRDSYPATPDPGPAREALRSAVETEIPLLVANALNELATTLLAAGETGEADKRYREARTMARRWDLPAVETEAQLGLARTAGRRGELDAGREHATQSLNRALKMGHRLLEAQAHLVLGELAAAGGDPAGSARHARSTSEIYRASGHLPGSTAAAALLRHIEASPTVAG
jgi:tetratricopeptide (TPR) repeat protein